MAKEKPGKLQVTDLRRPSRDHAAQSPAQGVAPRRRKRPRRSGRRAPKRRWPACQVNSRTGWRSKPTGSRPRTPPFSADGFTDETREELFRAAHDIKGDAATFGFPSAGAAAESLCRIIEHAPDLDEVPADLIAHHINAIQAIVRERTKLDTAMTASELSRTAARRRRRIPHPRQSRPSRAPRSHPRAEHRSGGVRSPHL